MERVETFTTPPPGFIPDMRVAGVVCSVGSEILLLKRVHHVRSQGGKWEIPGGKALLNEEILVTAQRELAEETALLVSSTDEFFPVITFYIRHIVCDSVSSETLMIKSYPFHVFALFLPKKPSSITLAAEEHDDYCWLPLKEAISLAISQGGGEVLQSYAAWVAQRSCA